MQLVGWQGNKTELLVVAFGLRIFGIYEKANAAGGVENVNEFFHGRNQEDFPDPLSLMCFGDGQPAQPDTGDVPRQFLSLIG